MFRQSLLAQNALGSSWSNEPRCMHAQACVAQFPPRVRLFQSQLRSVQIEIGLSD
jgi:hypothetical protein